MAPLPFVKTLNIASEFYIDEGCFIIELATAAEDPDLSIARCRVEPDKTTHWHKLRDTTERYLIQAGNGLVEIGDLPPRTVSAGDMVMIPPGCPQRISNTGSTDLLFLALCTPRFTPDIYENIENAAKNAL